MKHLIATALSLSVLVSGAALAAPQADMQRAGTAPVVQAATAQPVALPHKAEVAAQPAQVAGPGMRRPGMSHRQHQRHGAPVRHHGPRGHAMPRHMAHRHGSEGRRAFAGRVQLGAPLAERQQGVVVSKPRQHGLAKAPRGQEWRKIGQRYVRVTSGTNVVNEIVINGL